MPLQHGGDGAVAANIHELAHHGTKERSHAQIVAIAEHAAHEHKTHSPDDEGHIGSFGNDHVMVHNTHPHQQHSVGYHVASPRHSEPHLNHGLQAVHITHHNRDKHPEHHVPHGLVEHHAQGHDGDTQTVF